MTDNVIFTEDGNGREIILDLYRNVFITGKYPNIQIIVNPVNEPVMSLKNVKETYLVEETPVFFLMYNTENYYHFLYDTIPYLISCNKLDNFSDIKILVEKPKYRFVSEMFNILGFKNKLEIINENKMYETVYVSSSYTHGIDSNLPPREEVYSYFRDIRHVANFFYNYPFDKPYDGPKKIYISRRTWKHNQNDNIGTNYTTRRKLVNEDELVEYLESKGYTEVFTETMCMKDVIQMFFNVDSVVGAIGGGMANCLFCKDNTEVIPIISPTFLDVNNRFKYCFSKVNYKPFFDTEHVETTEFKKYMRIQNEDYGVGEISSIVNNERAKVLFSNEKVAGFSLDNTSLVECDVSLSRCKKLDNGLNSEWKINMEKFKEVV